MIHIICALKCEAKSLIAHFQLKHCAAVKSFSLYINRGEKISLTISGIGKINAAAATAFTHAFLKTAKQDIWLNIGIAGHADMNIGELTLAHKIIDQSTRKSWYPQFIATRLCHSVQLLSCDKPQTDYTNSSLSESVFEMEAAGFYATASRFATSELIHVIKIISDNQHQPADKISESFVTGLIKNKLDMIQRIMEALSQSAKNLNSPVSVSSTDYYDQIIDQWRFTHAQRNILESCLQRWQVLCPDNNPMHELDSNLKAKDVIQHITSRLDALPFSFQKTRLSEVMEPES